MRKEKQSARKFPKNPSTNEVTEEIVQMIAGSLASLPRKERLAAMQEFDKAAEALSSRGKKASRKRKHLPSAARRKKS